MHERRVQEAKMMKDQRLLQQNGLAERDKLQMEQNKDRSDYIKAKQAEHDLHEREVMHERRVQEAKMMKDQRQQKEIGTKLREEENIKVYKEQSDYKHEKESTWRKEEKEARQ